MPSTFKSDPVAQMTWKEIGDVRKLGVTTDEGKRLGPKKLRALISSPDPAAALKKQREAWFKTACRLDPLLKEKMGQGKLRELWDMDDLPQPPGPERGLKHTWVRKKGTYECDRCGFSVSPRNMIGGDLDSIDWEMMDEAVSCDDEAVAQVMER